MFISGYNTEVQPLNQLLCLYIQGAQKVCGAKTFCAPCTYCYGLLCDIQSSAISLPIRIHFTIQCCLRLNSSYLYVFAQFAFAAFFASQNNSGFHVCRCTCEKTHQYKVSINKYFPLNKEYRWGKTLMSHIHRWFAGFRPMGRWNRRSIL